MPALMPTSSDCENCLRLATACVRMWRKRMNCSCVWPPSPALRLSTSPASCPRLDRTGLWHHSHLAGIHSRCGWVRSGKWWLAMRALLAPLYARDRFPRAHSRCHGYAGVTPPPNGRLYHWGGSSLPLHWGHLDGHRAPMPPPGFLHFSTSPGSGGGGGEVAVISREDFKGTPISHSSFTSFEHLGFMLYSKDPVIILRIYRLPLRPNNVFIQEFADLSQLMSYYDKILTLGDFNIHVCFPSHTFITDFMDVLDSFLTSLKRYKNLDILRVTPLN